VLRGFTTGANVQVPICSC